MEAKLEDAEAKQRSLGAAFESLSSQASSILHFTVEWKELEDHFESTRRELRHRFEDLEDRTAAAAAMEAEEARLRREVERRRREVEEGTSYLDSVRSLIKENDEELKIREERFKRVERLIREKEREVEEVERRLKERSRKLSWVEMRIEVKSREVEKEERKLRELIEVRRKEVEESVANLDRRIELKEEMISVMDLKVRDFGLLKKSMEEWSGRVEMKEREVEECVAKLEMKEKEVQSKAEEVELIRREFLDEVRSKEKGLDSLEKSLLGWEKELHLVQKAVEECSRWSEVVRDGRGLQQFMDKHLKRIDSMGTELSAILRECSDPGKLILDAMQWFYPENRESDFELRVRRRSCCLLLEELRRISSQMNPEVKKEAMELATIWKAKMREASDNDLEVLGFLWLVAAYDLTSVYDVKELKRLLSKVSHGQQAAQIGLVLGITEPGCPIISPIKIEEPESTSANTVPTVSSPNPQSNATTDARDSRSMTNNAATISSNPQSGATSGVRDSRGITNEPLSWNSDIIQSEIEAAVQSAADPQKHVLNLMQKSLVKYRTISDASLKMGVMSCNISLLRVLISLSPQVGSGVKEDAEKLGLQWKKKIRADAEHLEIAGFMLFIFAYGLLPTLNGDEIVKFLEKLSQHKEALESCQMHGVLDKILAVFIETLVERNQLFHAVGFIFEFKLLDKFSPVRVLKDHVRDVITCLSETLKIKNSVDGKVEFLDSQIADLRTVLRCIKEYNLESEYPSREITEEIGRMEKAKDICRGSEKDLASISREKEHSQGKKRSNSTSFPVTQQGQPQKSKFHRTAGATPSHYKSPIFAPVLLQPRPSSSLLYGNHGQPGQAYNMATNVSAFDRNSSLVSGIHGQRGELGHVAANLAEVNPRFGPIHEVDPRVSVHHPFTGFTPFPSRYGPC